MGRVLCGLDLGSTVCHVAGFDDEGDEVVNRKFDTSEKNTIDVFKAIRGEVHVHMEAGELAAWMRQILRPHVHRVIVSDPKLNSWIAKDPNKEDSVDAVKLATLLRIDKYSEVYYDDSADRGLFKQAVRHHDELANRQAELKVKIKSRYRVQGVIVRGTTVFGPRGRKTWLDQVPSADARTCIEQLYSLLDHTLTVQKQAYEHMVQLAKKYPEIARFDKVPGVGMISACRFSAYIQTPHRFSAKRKVWRYCGLGVAQRSSDGKPLGRPRIDRWSGSHELKDVSFKVFLGAQRTKSDNLFQRTFVEVLKRTKDKTHARLTTQRKIIAVLWVMWRDGTEYQDDLGKVR